MIYYFIIQYYYYYCVHTTSRVTSLIICVVCCKSVYQLLFCATFHCFVYFQVNNERCLVFSGFCRRYLSICLVAFFGPLLKIKPLTLPLTQTLYLYLYLYPLYFTSTDFTAPIYVSLLIIRPYTLLRLLTHQCISSPRAC